MCIARGTILHDIDFKFHDGEVGEKLLIVLNTPRDDEPYLCIKTTKKKQYEIDREGCHSNKGIFYLNAGTDWFCENTWIQFDEFYPFTRVEFLRKILRKTTRCMSQLKDDMLNALINCVRRSHDLPKEYRRLIKH